MCRFLYIPLVCAERAWALGMELKQAANTEHRKRFHLMRRLQRAIKHANELVQLCDGSERCDARTRLEAQVSACTQCMSQQIVYTQCVVHIKLQIHVLVLAKCA